MKTIRSHVLSSLALMACAQAGFAGTPKESPMLQVQLHLTGKQSVAQVNRELARRGEKAKIPSMVTLDLSRSRDELSKKFFKISELAQKADADIDPSESLADACFTGSNIEVADNIDKLSDGWLSEQFQLIGKATKKPDHVGIIYSEGDDGTDRQWLNFERCQR